MLFQTLLPIVMNNSRLRYWLFPLNYLLDLLYLRPNAPSLLHHCFELDILLVSIEQQIIPTDIHFLHFVYELISFHHQHYTFGRDTVHLCGVHSVEQNVIEPNNLPSIHDLQFQI